MRGARDTAAVRADFDRIARLSPASAAPDAMTRRLLGHLPERCAEVLEIGCGTGEATRIAAGRAARVVALDSHGPALRRAYRDHGAHDEYLRPREAAALFAEHLPGARVTHHLRWRYSVVWRKPGE